MVDTAGPARSGYVEGERVFAPPSGTFDSDWVASAAQAGEPSLEHDRAVALADRAWALLRAGTPWRGLAPALADALPGPGSAAVAAVAVEYCRLYDVDPDPHDLGRFVQAQAGTYEAALAELRAGRKRGHWIWFVLPQLRGLGRSATSAQFGLRGLAEARAYAAHPVLGPRLRACVDALLALPDTDPAQVLGEVDAVKLRSCVTLFARADPSDARWQAVLDRWYDGVPDGRTLDLLG